MESEITAEELRSDFESVVRRFQKPLVNYLWRMVKNEETAMDLAQDVFIKAYKARNGFDGRSKVSTWLFAIASNHARDYLKRPRVVSMGEEEDAGLAAAALPDAGGMERPEGAMLGAELKKTLERALMNLPTEYREPVIMRHVNGMSVEAIAQALGMPEGTVKTRLFRGRERLQEMLLKNWGRPS
jgi:RNA polymerase sigma-70 factor (ECF subfamily)